LRLCNATKAAASCRTPRKLRLLERTLTRTSDCAQRNKVAIGVLTQEQHKICGRNWKRDTTEFVIYQLSIVILGDQIEGAVI
jgi:hypothetical protein